MKMFEIKAVYHTVTHIVCYASSSVWRTVSQKFDDVLFEFHIK